MLMRFKKSLRSGATELFFKEAGVQEMHLDGLDYFCKITKLGNIKIIKCF